MSLASPLPPCPSRLLPFTPTPHPPSSPTPLTTRPPLPPTAQLAGGVDDGGPDWSGADLVLHVHDLHGPAQRVPGLHLGAAPQQQPVQQPRRPLACPRELGQRALQGRPGCLRAPQHRRHPEQPQAAADLPRQRRGSVPGGWVLCLCGCAAFLFFVDDVRLPYRVPPLGCGRRFIYFLWVAAVHPDWDRNRCCGGWL